MSFYLHFPLINHVDVLDLLSCFFIMVGEKQLINFKSLLTSDYCYPLTLGKR